MRRSPRLQLPIIIRHLALAITERGEPQDQPRADGAERITVPAAAIVARRDVDQRVRNDDEQAQPARNLRPAEARVAQKAFVAPLADALDLRCLRAAALKEARHQSVRSEEHTSELQSLMRISYAVFCLKKKKQHTT